MTSRPAVRARTNGIDAPVAIIGAGPYGLSLASHLAARGIPFAIFGEPMRSWRKAMPSDMLLKSAPAASSLSAPDGRSSLNDFLDVGGEPRLSDDDVVSARQFVAYGSWFGERHASGVVNDTVEQLSKTADGAFTLQLASGGTCRATAVVIATGHLAHAYVPPELTALRDASDSAPVLTHSSDHSALTNFVGQRVAVIGGGQSALETAALLAEHGAHPELVVRAETLEWGGPPTRRTLRRRVRSPLSTLGTGWSLLLIERGPRAIHRLPASTRRSIVDGTLGPSGAWWLRSRFEGSVPVRASTRVTDARVDSRGKAVLKFADGSVDECDHVIAATGYRFDVRSIPFVGEPSQRQLAQFRGFPVLSPTFESTIPGLYFTGLAAAGAFGPLLRFVTGTSFASPQLAKGLEARLTRRAVHQSA